MTFLVNAQEGNQKKCMTTPLMVHEMRTNPEYKSIVENYFNNFNEWITKNPNSKNSVITIPVVVHVVHRQTHNLGIGTNIPQNQIEDAIRILNEDYRKTNPEFPNPPRNTFISYAGDTELEFCLATTDENGNATTGVTRTATSKASFNADDNTDANAMKRTATDGKDGWDPLCNFLNLPKPNIPFFHKNKTKNMGHMSRFIGSMFTMSILAIIAIIILSIYFLT